MRKKIPAVVLNDVFGDLSDGAYFAAMEEFGADPYALADVPDNPVRYGPARTHRCKQCDKWFRSQHARDQHNHDKHNAEVRHD